MRFTKVKDSAHIGRVGRHNFRMGKPSEGVDTSRSHLNQYLGVQSVKELHAEVKTAIATATRKPRPDASKMIEFYCGASPEFFEGKTYDESKAYLDDCYDWACETFGHENIVGAQYHFDECGSVLKIRPSSSFLSFGRLLHIIWKFVAFYRIYALLAVTPCTLPETESPHCYRKNTGLD